MTRKDYKLIAGVLKDTGLIPALNPNTATRSIQADMLASVAVHLAYKLGQDNPRFNSDIFLKECGIN